jgi:single-strand selective monofunctional uracil DNA glycosylase
MPNHLITIARKLSQAVSALKFSKPVTHVYNPLEYAWRAHEMYLTRCAADVKRVIFLGMNPGPWGMAQTGVPFGEVDAVSKWLGIHADVDKPRKEHPKRPIEGFLCKRSEVSGRRLWGLFADRFKKPDAFFADHFVANYCPLVFMSETGANITPDKLQAKEREKLEALCDEALHQMVEVLEPQWLIGVGGFAEARALRQQAAFPSLKVGKILHPSPASPAANRDWAGVATKQLQELGVW